LRAPERLVRGAQADGEDAMYSERSRSPASMIVSPFEKRRRSAYETTRRQSSESRSGRNTSSPPATMLSPG
jgi:hypothetical protein